MNCEACEKPIEGKRVDARFCNDTCKKRWQRKQKPAGKRGRPKSSGLQPAGYERSLPTGPTFDYVPPSAGCVQTEESLAEIAKQKVVLTTTHKPGDSVVYRSTSPTVALKQRTKQRILAKSGKAQGPSSTPKTEIPQGPDVLPSGHDPENPDSWNAMAAKINVVMGRPPWQAAQLPIENHGKTNDLARQTILSKVPTSKQDPNSDAATLARLNAAQQKPKKKGDA